MATEVLAFGELLWDIIDGEPHIGGAPFNFAAHAARCGLRTALVSAVGDDALGKRALDAAARLGVDSSLVATHRTLPTGTVNVTVKDGMPSYDIVRPAAWDEIPLPPAAGGVKAAVLYFGTLAQRSAPSAATLEALLDTAAGDAVFFDVNLRQDFWSRETVERGIAKADFLKVNDDERAILGLDADDLFARHPRLRAVIETRGAQGCVVSARGEKPFASPAAPSGPVVDTVGAGDAFAAAFIAEVLKGGSLQSAAEAGNRRAGMVAARPGAVPEDM